MRTCPVLFLLFFYFNLALKKIPRFNDVLILQYMSILIQDFNGTNIMYFEMYYITIYYFMMCLDQLYTRRQRIKSYELLLTTKTDIFIW